MRKLLVLQCLDRQLTIQGKHTVVHPFMVTFEMTRDESQLIRVRFSIPIFLPALCFHAIV